MKKIAQLFMVVLVIVIEGATAGQKVPRLGDSGTKEIYTMKAKSPKLGYFFGDKPLKIGNGNVFGLTMRADMDIYLGYIFPIFYQFNVFNQIVFNP
jgi:hypothetical protein